MKSRHIARGIVGTLSLMGVMGMVACSSEPLSPEEAAEIGETSQAIGVAVTEAGDFAYNTKFPAYIKIGANDALVVGGFSATAGSAIKTIRKVTYSPTTATWSKFLNGSTEIELNVARGDAQIAEIPGQSGKYLVAGGNSTEGSSSVLASAEIIDTTVSPITVTTIGTGLSVAREHFNLVPCGDKLLAVGGHVNGGVSNVLDVFTYNATHSSAAFATMKNKLSPFSVVTLTTAREFQGALPMSSTKVIVFGGDNGNGTALQSTEVLTVDANCALDVNDNTKVAPAAGGNMPAVRTKFAFAKRAVGNAEAILIGGANSAATQLTSYLWEDSNNTWSTGGSGLTLANPHVRASIAPDTAGTPASLTAGDLALVGGFSNFAETTPSDQVDIFTDSADTVTDLGTNLAAARVGAWAAFLNSTYIAGQGMTTSSTMLQTAE